MILSGVGAKPVLLKWFWYLNCSWIGSSKREKKLPFCSETFKCDETAWHHEKENSSVSKMLYFTHAIVDAFFTSHRHDIGLFSKHSTRHSAEFAVKFRQPFACLAFCPKLRTKSSPNVVKVKWLERIVQQNWLKKIQVIIQVMVIFRTRHRNPCSYVLLLVPYVSVTLPSW